MNTSMNIRTTFCQSLWPTATKSRLQKLPTGCKQTKYVTFRTGRVRLCVRNTLCASGWRSACDLSQLPTLTEKWNSVWTSCH